MPLVCPVFFNTALIVRIVAASLIPFLNNMMPMTTSQVRTRPALVVCAFCMSLNGQIV